jgi:hypothetical protein
VSDEAGDALAQLERHLVDADHGAIPLGDMFEEENRRRGHFV